MIEAMRGRWGFALGAAGVALYVAGTFVHPSFYSRYAIGLIFRIVPYPVGAAFMLYGSALVVLIVCIGGLMTNAERRIAWAVGLTAAAAAWASHLGGWMVPSIAGPPFFWFLDHPLGYQLMTAGALASLAGGILSLIDARAGERAKEAEEAEEADEAKEADVAAPSGERSRPPIVVAGFATGLLAVALQVAGTLVPYEPFPFPPSFAVVGASVLHMEVRALQFVPITLEIAALLALFGSALVIFVVSGAGLLARQPSRWIVALVSVAAIWAIRLLGERLTEQILVLWGHGAGWWLLIYAPAVAVAGALIALVGVRRTGRRAAVEPPP